VARGTRPEITVVLVDDEPGVRLLTRLALEEDAGIEILGEAADGRAGVEMVTAMQPDVVLLDIEMPVLDGLTALPEIRNACPDSHVVVVSAADPDRSADAALAAGAPRTSRRRGSPPTSSRLLRGLESTSEAALRGRADPE
jgi:DNA-binding NarL/FixJ family response regulator